MPDPIITVKGLSKMYMINGSLSSSATLKGTLEGNVQRALRLNVHARTRPFWALKDINFSLEQGEVLGIIGRNGAGKTTLLKIIARLTVPTTGSVIRKGTIGSYLGMGVGMNQELTGRENIHFSGVLQGMSRKEIMAKNDEIIDFSELGGFIDMPVKHYSSGMRARLAFSIAMSLDQQDVLLIDEALAGGDKAFCDKCLGKIAERVKQGQTALFVSHSIGQIERLTSRCLYLNQGHMAAYGPTQNVLAQYVSDMENLPNTKELLVPAI
jgi:lipopolysaccharide transport system ATP-binding protein